MPLIPWVAYHPCVGAAGKYYPENLNYSLAHFWKLSYSLDPLGLRRGGGVGLEVSLYKNNGFKGEPSPWMKCWKEGGHTKYVSNCIVLYLNENYIFKNKQKVHTWPFPFQQFPKYLSNCRGYMILYYFDKSKCSKINKKYIYECFHPKNFQSNSY